MGNIHIVEKTVREIEITLSPTVSLTPTEVIETVVNSDIVRKELKAALRDTLDKIIELDPQSMLEQLSQTEFAQWATQIVEMITSLM